MIPSNKIAVTIRFGLRIFLTRFTTKQDNRRKRPSSKKSNMMMILVVEKGLQQYLARKYKKLGNYFLH